MWEAPANFIEQYFPTRILVDVAAAGGGDRSGSLAALVHDGVAKRPALLIQAGDSDDNSAADDGPAYTGASPPNELELSRELIIPGYNHLDVATAAWRQNDGRPEPTAKALAHFARKVVAARANGPRASRQRLGGTAARLSRFLRIHYAESGMRFGGDPDPIGAAASG